MQRQCVIFYLLIALRARYASASGCNECNAHSELPPDADEMDMNILLQNNVRVVGGDLGPSNEAGQDSASLVSHGDQLLALEQETPAKAAHAAARAADVAAKAAAVAAVAAKTAASAAAATAKDITRSASHALPAAGKNTTGANMSRLAASISRAAGVGSRLPENIDKAKRRLAIDAARFAADSKWHTSEWSAWTSMQMGHVLHGLSFVMIVKALCILGNVLVQVSPLPQVRQWHTQGCIGTADPAPYLSIMFAGFQWCFYGIVAWITTSGSEFLILVQSNCLGAILGAYYVISYYRNCTDEVSLSSLQKGISAVSVLLALQVCALCVIPADRALILIGMVACFGSFTNAASMLVTIPAIIRDRSSSSISVPYVLANLISALLWCICGVMLEDPVVFTPNAFSVICSLAALALKAAFPSDVFLEVEEEVVGKKVNLTGTMAIFVTSSVKTAPGNLAQGILRVIFGISASPKQETLVKSASDVDGADGTGGTC